MIPQRNSAKTVTRAVTAVPGRGNSVAQPALCHCIQINLIINVCRVAVAMRRKQKTTSAVSVILKPVGSNIILIRIENIIFIKNIIIIIIDAFTCADYMSTLLSYRGSLWSNLRKNRLFILSHKIEKLALIMTLYSKN